MKRLTILISIIFAVFALNAQIVANFEWNDPQCSEGTVIFTDISGPSTVTSWTWKINGTTEYTGSGIFVYTFPQVTVATDFDISLYVSGAPYSDNITKTVTIYPLPMVTLPAIDDVCEGTAANLTASGAETYAWIPGNLTGASVSPIVWVETEFTVTGTDLNGCVNSASTTVLVNLIDTTIVDDVFCENATYDFHGTDLTTAGTYFHTLTSVLTGCDSVVELHLVQNPAPPVNAGEDVEVCNGSGVEIGSASQVGFTYLWSPTTALSDPNISNPVASPTVDMVYTVLMTDNATSCTASDDVTVTVNEPVVTDAGPDQTVCQWEIITMAGNITGGISTGTWSTSGDGSFSDVNALDANYTPGSNDIDAGSVILTLTSDDPSGPCGVELDAMTVTINTAVITNAGEDQTVCEGTSANLNGSISGGIESGSWYTTGDGVFSPDANALDATYIPSSNDVTLGSVILTLISHDPAGPCGHTSDPLTLTINPAPIADAGEDVAICHGSGVQIGMDSQVGFTYSWTPFASLNDHTISNPIATPTETTLYAFMVSDDATGCFALDQVQVTVNLNFLQDDDDIILCEGDSAIWRGTWYYTPGVYTDEYIDQNGCDSIYQVEVIVNSLPILVTVQQTPSDGILSIGAQGSVNLTTSYVGTTYWTTLGAAMFSGDILGDGSSLSLGSNYESGSYDVWSKISDNGCILKQGSVTFVENTGVPKLVVTPTYGNNQEGYVDGSVEVFLFKVEVTVDEDTVFIPQSSRTIIDGYAEFADLVPGNYVLKDVVDTTVYDNVMSVWYYDHWSADSATIIELAVTDILAVNINHPLTTDPNGSNTIGGSVVNIGDGGKSSTPMSDMVVIVRNESAGTLVAVTLTDDNGEYFFEGMPDDTRLQIYVSSFEHQKWIAIDTLTENGIDYIFDFEVNGDSIHPAGTSDIKEVKIKTLQFSLYPNPTSDFINFNNVPEGAQIMITSIDGRVVLNSYMYSNTLDISHFKSGIYTVVVNTKEGAGTMKFIKQ